MKKEQKLYDEEHWRREDSSIKREGRPILIMIFPFPLTQKKK